LGSTTKIVLPSKTPRGDAGEVQRAGAERDDVVTFISSIENDIVEK
jgi:hypothetical protein